MANSSLADRLNEHVIAELSRLRLMDVDALRRIGHPLAGGGIATSLHIDGEDYLLSSWSEPVSQDATGQFVVLAGVHQPRFFGSTHHLRGFIVDDAGQIRDLEPAEVLNYD